VAGARLGPRRPVRHLGELANELVLALLRLRERVAVQLATADPPAPGVVARRDPRLHLQDQDPVVGVDDDEVRFAVPRGPAVAHRAEPLGVRVEVECLGRQGDTDSLAHEALSGLPVRFHAPSCISVGHLRILGHQAQCGRLPVALGHALVEIVLVGI